MHNYIQVTPSQTLILTLTVSTCSLLILFSTYMYNYTVTGDQIKCIQLNVFLYNLYLILQILLVFILFTLREADMGFHRNEKESQTEMDSEIDRI